MSKTPVNDLGLLYLRRFKISSLFLSYAENDELFASQLSNELENQNNLVLKDCINMNTEMKLLNRIIDKNVKIDFLILIFSQSSSLGTIASLDWQDAIIDNLLHGRNWIIPIRIESCDMHPFVL